MVRFLSFLIGGYRGRKPKFLLGRPIPPSVRNSEALAVKHDRRISAGIFSDAPKKKGKDRSYRLVVWKSYQNKTGQWQTSTSFFPDEIDPALRLLNECRQALPPDESKI